MSAMKYVGCSAPMVRSAIWICFIVRTLFLPRSGGDPGSPIGSWDVLVQGGSPVRPLPIAQPRQQISRDLLESPLVGLGEMLLPAPGPAGAVGRRTRRGHHLVEQKQSLLRIFTQLPPPPPGA